MTNRIESGVVYEHDRYGEVLVTGIAKMYDEWSVDGPQDDIETGDVLVFFHDRFDGYGGMQPTPSTEDVNEFYKNTEQVRVHEHIHDSELKED